MRKLGDFLHDPAWNDVVASRVDATLEPAAQAVSTDLRSLVGEFLDLIVSANGFHQPLLSRTFRPLNLA